jgi:hypothetical protein
MRSGMAAIKANALHEQITKEYTRILSRFASNPASKHRATTKVVKTILLNGPYLLAGRYWEVKAKPLGAGVYELSAELKE